MSLGEISPGQCRAARGVLDWSQELVAEKAKISRDTLTAFEKGARTPHPNNLAMIRSAFEAEGVEFETGEGVEAVVFRRPALVQNG